MADNSNVAKSEEAESVDHAKSPDMFLKATEVAAAAKDVRLMAEHAHRKASYISALHERALVEADELSRIAHSVADTATSVAVMALQACQYRSVEDAFQANTRYSQIIDMDSFFDVVDQLPVRNRSHNSVDADNDPASSQRAPSLAASGRSSSTRKSAFQIRKPRSNVDKPVKQTEFSFPASSSHGSQDSDHKYLEKFPGTGLQNKDSLAQSLDHCSSKTEATLYEHVYAGPPRVAAAEVAPSSDSWVERKTRKQFQIKLHQQDSEDTSPSTDESHRRSRERTPLAALVKPPFPRGASDSSTTPECTKGGSAKGTRGATSRHDDKGVTKPRAAVTRPLRKSANNATTPSRAREDNGESTTDSEIEDYMTTPRQVALVRASDCTDADGTRLMVKTQPTNRVLSPLLDHDEQNGCRVVNKSPVQHTFQFQPRGASDREDNPGKE